MYKDLLNDLRIDYLLVNSTNEYLVEYPSLSENARYTLTGFSGSTGDALITKDKIYLFVDGRYHTQADNEVFDNITVVKLQLEQKQDDEIKKLINPQKTLGIVAKKVSQNRLESFSNYKIKLLESDPINNFTEPHANNYEQSFKQVQYFPDKPMLITNLEEVSYLIGLRDFSKEYSAKIWNKMFIDKNKQILFNTGKEYEGFLKNYEGELVVDKASINAYDYSLIKKPVSKPSQIKTLKSVKSNNELEAYKEAFKKTDLTMLAIREFIEQNNNLSEYDIAVQLKKYFFKYGAKSLSFKSIVAINQNSALAHYAQNDKNTYLTEGSLVLIDCGAYYESGLATDITRVFVKGQPSQLQKTVYTTVLKAFLNTFNSYFTTGYEYDNLAHTLLDNKIDGFIFNHGLGHGIGINVHENPPNLSRNEIAKTKIIDNMTFTIEPGLYNKEHFGVRLENSCYMKGRKIYSFTNVGYEEKLIDKTMLTNKEAEWLKDFKIL